MKCACCKENIEPFDVHYPGVPGAGDDPLCGSCYTTYVEGAQAAQKIVVLKGQANDWAAYRGWASLADWQIAAFGVKLDEFTARALFPHNTEAYRA